MNNSEKRHFNSYFITVTTHKCYWAWCLWIQNFYTYNLLTLLKAKYALLFLYLYIGFAIYEFKPLIWHGHENMETTKFWYWHKSDIYLTDWGSQTDLGIITSLECVVFLVGPVIQTILTSLSLIKTPKIYHVEDKSLAMFHLSADCFRWRLKFFQSRSTTYPWSQTTKWFE